MRRFTGVLAVALLAIGACTSPSEVEPSATSTATPRPSASTVAGSPSATGESAGTEVLVYTPYLESGRVSSSLRVASTVKTALCAESRVGRREDTFRCYERPGNRILDPCFMFRGDLRSFVCVGTPLDTDAVRVRPIKRRIPLDRLGTAVNPAGSTPWFIQTADGRDCLFLAGASTAVAGLRHNYFCTDDFALFGVPDRSHDTWTIMGRAKTETTLRRVPIQTAWY